MATKKTGPAVASRARGVLAANTYHHASQKWYGPSYPENGQHPEAATLPDFMFDARAVYPTSDDAARVGLDYGPPDLTRVVPDEPADTPLAGGEGS